MQTESNRTNNFAITAEGIGSSLTKSSAALVAAGNDIDETIALTTAANTILQDADTVGSSLKVVSMRLTKQPPYKEIYMLCA